MIIFNNQNKDRKSVKKKLNEEIIIYQNNVQITYILRFAWSFFTNFVLFCFFNLFMASKNELYPLLRDGLTTIEMKNLNEANGLEFCAI